jgi:hypothetical protein
MTSAVSPPAERERRSVRLPILGIMVAIAITSTMDAIGLTEFSALPLFPLMLLFWRIPAGVWVSPGDAGETMGLPFCIRCSSLGVSPTSFGDGAIMCRRRELGSVV